MKLWKGKEIEGKYKGFKTLFIGDYYLSIDEIERVLHKDTKLKQLYFGAGICTKINIDSLRYFIENYKHKIISAEISLEDLHKYPIELLRLINVIIVITHKNFYINTKLNKYNTFIKIQSLEEKKKYLSIGNCIDFEETNMDTHRGKIYQGDEVIK